VTTQRPRETRNPTTGPYGPATGAGALCLLLGGLTLLAGVGPVGVLAGAGYAVVVYGLLMRALRRAGDVPLGPAGRVTGVRLVLIGGVAALVADGAHSGGALATLVALAAVALILDAVDGFVARRTGTSSDFGARLDMEADAALILILSAAAAASLGWWTLAIGAMRYVFAAAACVAPWLTAPLPPSTARKAVAALQGIVLTTAVSQVPPHGVSLGLVAAALALLVWSFGRDVWWLYRWRAS
jgi:phosphatidylglycerophosphate synthase